MRESLGLLVEYEFVIWDLDNTLYSENDFLFQAYEDFSKNFEDADSIKAFLISTFEKEGRFNLISKMKKQFQVETNDEDLRDLFFKSLREKVYDLELFSSVESLISKLDNLNIKQGIITNGNVAQQKSKVKALKLKEKFSFVEIVFANDGDKKPSCCSFDRISQTMNIKDKSKVIYIGDSQIDSCFAKNAGIDFIFVNDVL